MNYGKADTASGQSLNSEHCSHAMLMDELDNGLHAMAQPLTVLRGVIGALRMRGGIGPEHARYLDISDDQIQRLCHLLSELRCLLDVAQNDPIRKRVNLLELIAELMEEQESSVAHSGLRIVAVKPKRPVVVTCDPDRVEHALRAALVTAVQLASRGDVIHIDVTAGDRFVDLRIRNDRAHSRGISSANRLNLALAQANTLSQQGIFEYSADPFSISMKMPVNSLKDEVAGGPDLSTLREAC